MIPSPALLAGEGQGEGSSSGPKARSALRRKAVEMRNPHLNPLPRAMRERRPELVRRSPNDATGFFNGRLNAGGCVRTEEGA